MRSLISALILLSSTYGHAAAYKCTDAFGNIAFQERPCASSERSDEITLAPAQTIQSDNPLPTTSISSTSTYNPESTTADRNPSAPGGKTFCKNLVAQYKSESNKIKAACKQARNTYCDRSAEEIEKIQDNHFLRTASSSQMANYYRNNESGTPLARLKQQISMYRC